MDDGSLGEEAPASRPGQLFDHHHPQHHHNLHQEQLYGYHQHQQHQHPYDPYEHHFHPGADLDRDLDPRPGGQIPPLASHAAASNLQAFAANSAAHDSLDDSQDPDDFYRSYRGAQPRNETPQTIDPMAQAASHSRQTPSARSNGNGATSKPSALPTSRNALRPSQRAVSNPVDDRSSKAANAFPTSVREMKKKFDQTVTQPGSTARKPPPKASSSTNGRTTGTGSNSAAYASSRGTTSGARGPQRPTDDQISSSSQSFASRISRPRTANSTHPQQSKSSSHASPRIPAVPKGPEPGLSRQPGLLFGEILPEHNDSATVGFGIENVRPRRTSESSIHHSRLQMRSLSDPDIEPPSPTDWYRAAAPSDHQASDHPSVTIPKNHHRAQSDFAGSKLGMSRHFPNDSAVASPISPTSPTSTTSRLPIMVKKISNQSDSPASTRSNSPSLRYAAASGRTSRQHMPSSRSRTPTTTSSVSTPQIKTPTARKGPPSSITTTGSRLNAHVAVPAPKLSPSLRSSRPRQSVATATTAASRMRTVERERGASPQRQALRPTPKAEGSGTRRRKLSVGPIDFAQRRETIKLAYSKSIRDSQAKEARQAAADKRKRELEVVAKIKLEAEAATMAAVANANAAAAAAAAMRPARSTDNLRHAESGAERDMSSHLQPPAADVPVPPVSSAPAPAPAPAPPMEPLRLEIPGSFPSVGSPQLEPEDVPLSACSASTATTEFEIDEEPEPPKQESTAAIDEALGITMPGLTQITFVPESFQPEPSRPPVEQTASPVLHRKASYQYPFDDEEDMDDDSVSIKISLDTSAESQMSPQLTPTRTDFQPEPTSNPAPIPDGDDDEYVPRPYTFTSDNYETTVTILGPENDFRPLHQGPPRVAMPAADLPQQDDRHVASSLTIEAPETLHLDDVVRFEEPRIVLDKLDRIEDFYVGPRLSDNVASLRDSTCTSSDSGAPFDTQPALAEYEKTPNTLHSLTVPSLLAPGNRLSQNSAWTDFSFGSDDHNAGLPSSTSQQSLGFDSQKGGSSGLLPITADFSLRDSGLGEFTGHSPEKSPLDRSGATTPPMLTEQEDSGYQHSVTEKGTEQVPEEEECQTEECDEDVPQPQEETVAARPQRQPPPPPSFEFVDDERETSVYGQETRPTSFLHPQQESRPHSEVLSPDSGSQITFETLDRSNTSVNDSETLNESIVERPSLSAEAQEEQKRLRQRQLVIRELIDTEDAFVRDMSVVEEIYKGTAEACPNLDSKTIKLIFRNTDEIIAFHAAFVAEFKEGASAVYTPKARRSPVLTPSAAPSLKDSDSATLNSVTSSAKPELDDEKDRLTSIGPVFSKSIEQLKAVHEVYLRSSDQSSKRLVQIQEDEGVMLWLNECNEVAKELTSAWNLDSLLVKPMQRITKYPDIITHLLKYTPADHPDREPLIAARLAVIDAIDEINKSKKNYELVGQIVGNRKRKDSDVRGLARAFGKRVDKLQATNPKTAEDEEYKKLQQQFGDDYLRLQVVLRDVEYYTRNVSTYVHEFLQYLSSMELVMRLQPSRDYAHIESKWVQFNVSMRDIEKIALERHLSDVRKHVIEPFEQVIKCYGNPGLAMKKRAKRRLDYEKYAQLKANGKKVDKQLTELVEQYEALNETLKKELPKLSAMTAKIGNICLGKFISIQTAWYKMWKDKVKAPLQDANHVPEVSEIASGFQREFALQEERAMSLAILNPTLRPRFSQSTTDGDNSSLLSRTKSRPSDLQPTRSRGLSINSEHAPTLPTPDFVRRNSGQFSLSPASSALPSPAHYYRDYYSGINGSHARVSSNSPITPDPNSRSAVGLPMRPGTGRSFDSNSLPRQSTESTVMTSAMAGGPSRRDSNSTYNSSAYPGPSNSGGDTRRLSGLFHSALPPDDAEDFYPPQMVSRASSTQRSRDDSGYRVLWLAASLFEFHIETSKMEAGYPYLTYQAGEIFDVIAEKGELWLARNQDDPRGTVGWIWSKHFAKLADS
ncbi:hypothetical protein B0T21DRAFT_343855 [Apiosordaria backusii]|uniref:DH domain-containing protein n=1 Tax=Apiosordaria backusii TaxID=314023 RepID=A0AA40EZ12_9PEZI|nr:hypothetical protein B0T21DRAFT_343855 [Apiosordaria backusii]